MSGNANISIFSVEGEDKGLSLQIQCYALECPKLPTIRENEVLVLLSHGSTRDTLSARTSMIDATKSKQQTMAPKNKDAASFDTAQLDARLPLSKDHRAHRPCKRENPASRLSQAPSSCLAGQRTIGDLQRIAINF